MQTLHTQEQNPNPTGMASPKNWGWKAEGAVALSWSTAHGKFWIGEFSYGTCAKIFTLFTKINN